MHQPIIGRFAPSPSGRMHLGNVLCALLSWLSCRSKNGGYLLRIEDLDTQRCTRERAALLMDDLRWLGLDWDAVTENSPGSRLYAPALADIPRDIRLSAYQSVRTPIYEHLAGILREKGLLYPCFCTRAELHAASAPHLSDGSVLYTGACRNLTPAEAAARALVRAPAVRVRVPDETVAFVDGCRGAYAEHLPTACGDFLVQRSDGMFAYQLAVTVDDGLMGVTEVVRGSDLIGSTARQIWLHRLFGFEPPAYCHIPLLLAPDGRRLSKRDGDLDLGLLRTRMTAEQLVGALAFAAGLTDRSEPVTARELLPAFSWNRVRREDICLPPL